MSHTRSGPGSVPSRDSNSHRATFQQLTSTVGAPAAAHGAPSHRLAAQRRHISLR
ncbi:hypothetical protein ACWF76_06215 [Streptomyces globisporus]